MALCGYAGLPKAREQIRSGVAEAWAAVMAARLPRSILYNMRLELFAVRGPASAIELPFGRKTGSGGIGHGQGVVRVVMGEQSLAAEGKQAFDSA